MIEAKGMAKFVYRLRDHACAVQFIACTNSQAGQRNNSKPSGRLSDSEDKIEAVCKKVGVGDSEHACVGMSAELLQNGHSPMLSAPRFITCRGQWLRIGYRDGKAGRGEVFCQHEECFGIGSTDRNDDHRTHGSSGSFQTSPSWKASIYAPINGRDYEPQVVRFLLATRSSMQVNDRAIPVAKRKQNPRPRRECRSDAGP